MQFHVVTKSPLYIISHRDHKRSENSYSGRFKRLKTKEKIKPSAPHSGRGRLQEVVVYERFQL